jgi:hypothetical protein
MINFDEIKKSVDSVRGGIDIKKIKAGAKVRCISTDESQSRWGGNDSAEKYLEAGKIYTLSRDPEIHSWHTKFYLEEVPGRKFNSVQFEEVE